MDTKAQTVNADALYRIQAISADLLTLMPAGLPPEMRAWKDAVREIWCITMESELTNAKNSENVALINRTEANI